MAPGLASGVGSSALAQNNAPPSLADQSHRKVRHLLGKSQHEVHVLNRLSGRAFAQVVERGEHVDDALALDGEVRVVVPSSAGRCGARRSRNTVTNGLAA